MHASRTFLPNCNGPIGRPALILIVANDNTELLHLAESVTAAELWIAKEGHRNARLEIVGEEGGERAGGADIAA